MLTPAFGGIQQIFHLKQEKIVFEQYKSFYVFSSNILWMCLKKKFKFAVGY